MPETEDEKLGKTAQDIESEQPQKEKKESVWSILLPMVIAVIAALLFCNFVARPSRVFGESMQNTFHEGDLTILWELNYHPQRGDIIVVDNHNNSLNGNDPLNKNLIKRVMAVGGDHIAVSQGTVTVNGKKLTEPYVKEKVWSGSDVDLTIPQGKVFLMGDNRSHSADSRVIGPVSMSRVIGKVCVRFYPFTAIRTF